MTLAVVRQEYTKNGVHRVIIRDIEESPIDNLTESSSITRYSRSEIKVNNNITPFIQEIEKEVKKLPHIKRIKFQKILMVSYMALLPFLPMGLTNAQALETNFPLIGRGGNEFLPPEVMQILVKLILALGTLGVILAIGCLMVAGAMRMLGNQQKAQIWSKNIIGGLGQILLSPVIILILTTIVALLFRNVPALNIFY